MSPMDHSTFDELKDAYVLGALPEDERADFEAYLAAHPERQAEIDELAGVAGMLALVPPEHEPSAELRSRVMHVVASEASEPRTTNTRPSSWFGRLDDLRNVGLAVAAVLLVSLVSWNVLLQGDVRELRGQVEEARSEEGAPAAQPIQLEGTWVQQGATAEVASLGDDRAVLILEGIPSVPEDRTLQVWIIEGETPESGGLLEPAANNAATPITAPLEGADVIAVTVEPAGGSDLPTTDPVLVKEL